MKGDQCVAIPDDTALRQQIIYACHDTPYSGHLSSYKTIQQIRKRYWWKGIINSMVERYVGTCASCQMNKPSQSKPAGLLQPVQVPDRPWSSISVDFITGLPEANENKWDTVPVFVDRFSKMVHFVP
jgi:hypothetical protein